MEKDQMERLRQFAEDLEALLVAAQATPSPARDENAVLRRISKAISELPPAV